MAATGSSAETPAGGEGSGSAVATESLFLVFGGRSGWIGQKLVALLERQGKRVVVAESRLEDREGVARELDRVRPTHVFNAAGLTGRPNVDWCEDHKDEVVRVNVVGTLALLDSCFVRKIHCTNFATGCIYSYDAAHPMFSGVGFTESDPPNFTGSFYSETKTVVDRLSRVYEPTTLTLRVRMPISDDLSPRNFVTKIVNYRRVANIPNSMSVLFDLLPAAVALAERGHTGVFNFTNPGAISHNEILDLYREHIDPDFWYENFTVEEQARILKAPRSNNELDASKLVRALPDLEIPPIRESIVRVFRRMREHLLRADPFPPVLAKGPRPDGPLVHLTAREVAAHAYAAVEGGLEEEAELAAAKRAECTAPLGEDGAAGAIAASGGSSDGGGSGGSGSGGDAVGSR